MRKLLFALLTVAVSLAGTALAQPYENSTVVGQVPDRVVITVKEGVKMNLEKAADGVTVGVAALDDLSKQFQVRDMEQLYKGMTGNLKNKDLSSVFDRVWAVDFDDSFDRHQVKKAYEALPEVELVRLVDICRLDDATLPNDLAGGQWYLRNTNPGQKDVRAVGAWAEAQGDSNIIVAVLDSGMDWQHPDLGGSHPDKVNGAIWTNWAEYYGNPGVDDDGNGKVDDIRGWDFVNLPANQGYPDEDVTTPDNDPMDYEGHGTNCAGVIAPITNNGLGVAGTAPGCKIMGVRVGWLPNGESVGVVRMDFAAQGILYAINNGARIINCSWGNTSYLSLSVNAALDQGVLIFSSAGNDDDSVADYLGTVNGVMSVAATTQSDGKASFSSYGWWVDISAPGVAIYTTNHDPSAGSGYISTQGTSFSSPLAAGCAALVWSANPGWTRQQVYSHLQTTADDLDSINPSYAGELGAGRINLLRALGDEYHQYPAEFPTLFDAMNSASPGDTVQVLGGLEITGPLEVIGGKDLPVLGGYDASYTTRDPVNNKTIVTSSASNTALKFVAGAVGNGTLLDGFVFQGGGGVQYSGIPFNARYGGGVTLNGVSPTLRNIEVTGCSVGSSSELGCGGGVMLNNSSAVLENVHIHGNTAIYGAGLFANNSSPTLIDCVIEDNTVIGDHLSYTPHGGGIYAVDSALTMTGTTVSGNLGLENGGGLYVTRNTGTASLEMTGGAITGNSAKTNGGGLYMDAGAATLRKVTISGNDKTADATFMNGGGFNFAGTSVVLDSLVCQDNMANAGGGGVFNACSSAEVSNSLFTGNTGQFYGGALSLATTDAVLSNNTLAENEATFSGGGGIYAPTGSLTLTNNISAFNTGAASFANGVHLGAAPAAFSCNDVYGNTGADYSGFADPTGTDGNVSVDPLFCTTGDNLFNLQSSSPCLPGGSGGCGLIGALTSGCGSSPVLDPETGVPSAFFVQQAFPNPFNPKTTIRFSLPEDAHTSVVIYDVAGRKVRTVVDEMLPARVHDVSWTGDDDSGRRVAAGMYFYMVTSGDHRSVGRMALVK